MFEETADLVNQIKEKAMDAMLPAGLPMEMRKEFLELSHKMTPKQIAEVGEKILEARRKARDEFLEMKKYNEQEYETI